MLLLFILIAITYKTIIKFVSFKESQSSMSNLSVLRINQTHIQVLARNLSMLLEIRGISENEIAQSLDIPVMTIRRIASGKTGDPRISTLKLIADYLNVSIDSLLEDNDKKPFNIMAKNKPQLLPLLDWKTAGTITSLKDVPLNLWKKWQPIFLGDNTALSENAFILESRPSMQPRFPIGTLFVIDPNEAPIDADIILVKMIPDGNLSLRELIIDSPRWQLQPIVTGSEPLFYDQSQHCILGVVIVSMLHTRKDK